LVQIRFFCPARSPAIEQMEHHSLTKPYFYTVRTDANIQNQATETLLAQHFGLHYHPCPEHQWHVLWDGVKVSLHPPAELRSEITSISVDFDHQNLQRRCRRANLEHEGLIRAAKALRPSLQALDPTGGLGRDSWLLASAGCHVDVIEAHPLVAAILHDGWRRACLQPQHAATAQRIRIYHGRAEAWLTQGKRHYDIACMDTLFPLRAKNAKPDKFMQILRFCGVRCDENALLEACRNSAQRTIVKRRRSDPALGLKPPQGQMIFNQIRYDLYID